MKPIAARMVLGLLVCKPQTLSKGINPQMKTLHRSAARDLFTSLVSLLLVFSFASGQQPAVAPVAVLNAEEQAVSASIKIDTIKEVVAALSADDMQGRGTMQAGGDKAANYIADRFAKIGLKPLGNKDSYLQPIKFRETQYAPDTSFKIGDETLQPGRDYYVSPLPSGDKTVSGDLVFVAYGLT